MKARELEEIGKERDEDYFTSEDAVEQFIVHDQITYELIEYMVEAEHSSRKEILRSTDVTESNLDYSPSDLEDQTRWNFYTSDEGILTEEEEIDNIPYYSLDTSSKYLHTFLENNDLEIG